MTKDKTKFVIIATQRIVGILSQELPLDHFAAYDFRGTAKSPEMDAKYCDFCGYVTRAAVLPDGPKGWTVRLSRRQPPAYALNDPTWRPEVLSHSFLGNSSSMLNVFPPSILFIDLGDLAAFRELCHLHDIGHHVRTYAGEIAVTPTLKSIAA